jgi:hypothetical protein
MNELVETWLLKAVDGRDVFLDLSGNCTLQGGGSNKRFEFRKDEHSGDNSEALAKKVSYLLGVDCVWLSKFYESEEDFDGQSGNVPLDRQ